jgi:hypothetical protein
MEKILQDKGIQQRGLTRESSLGRLGRPFPTPKAIHSSGSPPEEPMLEHFWCAVGWAMGCVIVAGFQVLIWIIDFSNATQGSWRRVGRLHLPLLGSGSE